MLGAIIGDVVGSRWEGSRCEHPQGPLLGFGCELTDDTVCSVAVAQALLEGRDVAATLREWVRRYPNRGYGGQFHSWAHSERGPYNSFANGGAMRVSAVGWLAPTREAVRDWAYRTAEVTHNHPEGLRGAYAIALAIWLARQGQKPEAIRQVLREEVGYPLKQGMGELAEAEYGFSVLAEETVPEALIAALEARSYEEALCNALRIGGDTDTLACMAGGVAEALFGLPEPLVAAARDYVPEEMWRVAERVYHLAGQEGPRWTRPGPEPSPAPDALPRRLRWLSWLRRS